MWKLALIEKFKKFFKIVAREITYNKIDKLVIIKVLVTIEI